MKEKGLFQKLLAGALCGFINGLFGSGGGVIAVMALRRFLPQEQRVHATATLTVFLMSAVSFALYLTGGSVDLAEGLRYLPGGFAGALLGAKALKNCGGDKLRRFFGGVIALSGAVMFLR
ncbi:MAG: sulfite exporter TauE/SafE family protein [Oscillospiraceae bacterium]|nr:sulfite exporter TauE/SafE family protein [Oscillospiraceae bacterium]